MPLASIDWSVWLSPWVLGVFGLCIGSFLNVVIHRVPLMLERQWLHESAAQLTDASAMARVAGVPQAEADQLAKAVDAYGTKIEALPPFGISKPRSRCPHCGHQLRWHVRRPATRGSCRRPRQWRSAGQSPTTASSGRPPSPRSRRPCRCRRRLQPRCCCW